MAWCEIGDVTARKQASHARIDSGEKYFRRQNCAPLRCATLRYAVMRRVALLGAA